MYYNSQYQSSSNDINTVINSVTNLNSSTFESINNADNVSLKQYVEWHKKHNEHNTTTFVVNQAYGKETPQNHWFTNQPFLAGLIPLQNDTTYTINQVKRIKNNSIDALFKYYWIIDSFNHLYTNIGNNFITSSFETSEKQLLTDGSINDFSNAEFGNNVKYKLNDAYIGLEYKFKIGRWSNKPAFYIHWYHLYTNQSLSDIRISKTLIQPQFNSDFEFNKSESLNFSYKLSNTFPEVNQLANQFTLQSYNSVFKGNALLQNEQYHSANLRYSKLNMYQGINLNATASFNKKVKTTRNEVVISGINQFTTPILTDNPETNWRFNGFVSKKIYRFNLKLNSNLNWFNYIQSINNEITTNKRNNQSVGLTLKTAHKKLPDLSIGYNKAYSQFKGITTSNFQSDEFITEVEFTFCRFFIFKLDYENLKNTNSNGQSNYYDVANTSLRYQKKNSPFGFELFSNNLFNNRVKNDYSFSDFLISERSTYVLPRVFMLSISYKL